MMTIGAWGMSASASPEEPGASHIPMRPARPHRCDDCEERDDERRQGSGEHGREEKVRGKGEEGCRDDVAGGVGVDNGRETGQVSESRQPFASFFSHSRHERGYGHHHDQRAIGCDAEEDVGAPVLSQRRS